MDPTPPTCCACARACALSSWYMRYRHVSLPTTLLPLPPAFLAYLASDGVVLPPTPPGMTLSPLDPRRIGGGDSVEASPPASSLEAPAPSAAPPCFPELELAIATALAAHGGAVLPKLDWSAPSDATWVAPSGSLRCESVGEVFLLLKASDLARYDCELAARVAAAEGGCGPPPHLALRAWYAVHPSGEFRVFVRAGRVVGISQRHTAQRFDWLQEGRTLEEARAALLAFHARELAARPPLAHFAFDAYIDRRGRVWLLDFAPCGYDTSPLLFAWEELGCTGVTCEHVEAGDAGALLGGPALAVLEKRSAPPSTGSAPPPSDELPPIRTVEEGAAAIGFAPLAVHRFPDDLLRMAAGAVEGEEGAPPQGAGLTQMLDWLESMQCDEEEDSDGD